MKTLLDVLEGRWLVSLCIVLQTVIFMLPLPHRRSFPLRLALSCGALLWGAWGLLRLQSYFLQVPLVIRTLLCVVLAAVVLFCCSVSIIQALYTAIWVTMTQQTIQNLWNALFVFLRTEYQVPSGLWRGILGMTLVLLPLIYWGVARVLTRENYTLATGHFLTVSMLYAAFEVVQGTSEIDITEVGLTLGTNYQFVLMNGICLLIAMYLVHTLFTKREAQAQLALATALRQYQQEHYEQAKAHIALINRRCHQLKVQLARLQRAQGSEEKNLYMEELAQAIDLYDAGVDTGNDVLNMILGESGLRCREYGIALQCVADGALLSFISAADLYVIFSALMGRAISCVKDRENRELRQIDVALYQKKGIAVVEVHCPLEEEVSQKEAGDKIYGNLENVLRRYEAACHVDARNGMLSQRCLIPVAQPHDANK